jgi:hypothetical protein
VTRLIPQKRVDEANSGMCESEAESRAGKKKEEMAKVQSKSLDTIKH